MLRLVYPPDGHITFERSTFFIGSVEGETTLTVNRQPVPVSDMGFFAHKVDLLPGENRFLWQAQSASGALQEKTVTVISKQALSIQSVEAHPEQLADMVFPHELAFPQTDVGVAAGDTIMLYCPAPQGAAGVSCQIESLFDEPLALQPLEKVPDLRQGIFARLHHVQPGWPTDMPIFGASYRLPSDMPSLPNLAVSYIVEMSPESVPLQFETPGSLTILPANEPQYIRITTAHAAVKLSPGNGSRRTPLLEGVVLPICGFEENQFKLRYAGNNYGWVAGSDLTLLESPVLPICPNIPLIRAEATEGGIELRISLARPLALDYQLLPNQVVLQIYGAVSTCDFIHYLPGVWEQGLASIRWEQTNAEQVTVWIELDSTLMGFSSHYDTAANEWAGKVKTQVALPQNTFRIILDPGHGGKEPGATAPDGTPEKALNLAIALQLKSELEKYSGLTVILTRTGDETVSLEDRIRHAQEAQGHLLLSLHHNALPDGRDPLEEKGLATFYYHLFSLPWAKALHQPLVQHTDFDDYGILYDSLYLCRVPAMPAVMLELGFLTHPLDAARCLDQHHQHHVVQTIARALHQKVSSLPKQQKNK